MPSLFTRIALFLLNLVSFRVIKRRPYAVLVDSVTNRKKLSFEDYETTQTKCYDAKNQVETSRDGQTDKTRYSTEPNEFDLMKLLVCNARRNHILKDFAIEPMLQC